MQKCADCTLLAYCGRVTDPQRTGVDCPNFRQWESRLAKLERQLSEQAYWRHVCAAADDAYNNREHPVF